ncbi:hypothetical protein NL676_013500 [Syzygium grande]|nr:hypothetical protein NL676_013500 [Syzygium grande]
MSVVDDNDDDDARGLSGILACHLQNKIPSGNPEDGWLTGLLAVVDWWITMLHVMIALGRTCVCKCSVFSKWRPRRVASGSTNRNAARIGTQQCCRWTELSRDGERNVANQISNIDGATVGATRASSVVVKVVWSRDGATVGRSRA